MPGVIQGGDTAVAWTVTGTGFDTGATVSLPYTGVTISGVTVVSSTQITFMLSAAANTATGSAQLTVTNPDMTTALVGIPAVVQVVSLSGSVQPLFDQSCSTAGCHSAASSAAGLNLSSGASWSATVNVSSSQVPSMLRVAPGDPASSYLLDKLEGTHTVGGLMPLVGGPLTATEVMLVRKWIEAGALNN